MHHSKFDDIDLETIELKTQTALRQTINQKPKCSCESENLIHSGHSLVCLDCGREVADSSPWTEETDQKPDHKNYTGMRIIGKQSYGQSKSLLKSSADYGKYRHTFTLKEIQRWDSQSESGKHFPKNITSQVTDMYSEIRASGRVFRKNIKRGIISALLYYCCYANGISQTPTEIAQRFGIEEKFHSTGDRILRDLAESGIIELPETVDPLSDYIDRYFEILKISPIYRQFVLEIIETAAKNKLHVLCDSKNNTKCIGAIYLLLSRLLHTDAAEQAQLSLGILEQKCEISKTTYLKYYTMICKYYKIFAHIFIIHKIPLKQEWKVSIDKALCRTETPNESASRQAQQDESASHIGDKINKPIKRTIRKPRTKKVTALKTIDEQSQEPSQLEKLTEEPSQVDKPIKKSVRAPRKNKATSAVK